MKNIILQNFKTKLLAFFVLMLCIQPIFGQDALTSVKINIQDFKISKDLKTISYDVYLQDVNATYKVAVPGYGFQLAVPHADLDTLVAKTVTVTNANASIGAKLPTMSVKGGKWVMKFQNNSSPLSYDAALLLSEAYPGTRLATFNITNTNGSAFTNPQQFTATFAGTSPSTKTSISVFLQDQVSLATNSNTAQPTTNFNGLGVYSLIPPPTPLTISGVIASNKVYDGNAIATLTGGTLVGIENSEIVTLIVGTGAFSSKTAGTSKVVTATGYSLGGADASKYILSAQPSGLTADITSAPLSISGVTASSKVYDRTTVAALSVGSLVGVVSGDVVNLDAGTGAFSDNKVGDGKTVTATGYAISGADAANYTLSGQPSDLSANITVASLTTTGVSASNKSYNGNTVATLTGGTLVGIISGDVVNLVAGTGAFSDKNIGTGKVVTATGYSIDGADATNYILSAQPSDLTANITTSSTALTISGVTASNKVYDRTTVAALSVGSLVGIFSGDVVNLDAGTGAFSDNKVGDGKTVTATGYAISGADAANYTLSGQPSDLSANITVASLTTTGVSASNKSYNGNTVATLTGGTLVGIISGDVVNLVAGTGAFSDKNIGTGKVVTATGYSIDGADATNYILSAQPSDLTANITTSSTALTISGVTASNKVYDRTTVAALSVGSLVGIFSGDVVNLDAGTGAFSDNKVGDGKTVTATGYAISGTDAANYTLSGQPSDLSANITVASLTTTGVSASNKSYNGNTVATLTGGTLVGIISGDVVNLVAGTGAFSDKNIGTGKVVTATGYSIDGADATNYILSAQPSDLTANITALSLTVSAPSITLLKIYDATTTASATAGILSGVLDDEIADVDVIASATYDNASIATGKTITVSYTLSGPAALNYIAPTSSNVTTGVIIPVPLQLSIKAYLEGLWNGTSMNKYQNVINDELIDMFPGNIADTLTVELHDMTTYGTVLYSANGLQLHQDGSITSPGFSYIDIPGEFSGNYRLTIKHRNHLETASASAVSFSTPTINFDFTDSSVKAYSSEGITFTPTKLLNGKWMMYVGNIMHGDYPEINTDDLYETFDRNSLAIDVYGYVVADMNGDGSVDDSDFYLTAANLLIYFYLP